MSSVSGSIFGGKLGRGSAPRISLPDAIADFLGFSGKSKEHIDLLRKFRPSEWKHAITWLHDAGLALYFLQKLKDKNATDVLPEPTLARLEENLTANRRRVTYMSGQFKSLNEKFDASGVRYVVVKGFALIPQFCPDACLRHQSDFDYLVDSQSLPLAQRVLLEAGYLLTRRSANELVFLMPLRQVPPIGDEQYNAHAPHAVELRLAFWDVPSHGVLLAEPKFSFDNVRTHSCHGLTFRTLPEEDAFLLQVLHAVNHVLNGWIRMSWLYEIGYFLKQRASDPLLWRNIERRVGGDARLREMVALVTELSAQFFAAPMPSTIRSWAENLRSPVRVWIQDYARTWAFENIVDEVSLCPVAKLVLFLHQQYLPDARTRRHFIRIRMLPLEQLIRRAHSITAPHSTSPRTRTRQVRRGLIRFLFHVTGGLRYLWEIPRWRRLNKAAARLAGQRRAELDVAPERSIMQL